MTGRREDRAADFDVFLSHNNRDMPAVRALAQALEERTVKVWLADDRLVPGVNALPQLEKGIEESIASAVLIGKDGLGPWENEEMQALLRRAVELGRSVIPVLLPGAPDKPALPLFLANRVWVDLRSGLTDEVLERLVWGITGERPRGDRHQRSPSCPTEPRYRHSALFAVPGEVVVVAPRLDVETEIPACLAGYLPRRLGTVPPKQDDSLGHDDPPNQQPERAPKRRQDGRTGEGSERDREYLEQDYEVWRESLQQDVIKYRDKSKEVRRAIAKNPCTPPAALAELARDVGVARDRATANVIAENPSTPPHVLAQLAEAAPRAVAKNRMTPPDVLATLVNHPDSFVQNVAAQNSSTPLHVLAEAAGGANGLKRFFVADNPTLPPDILARLAKDPGNSVRARVAKHPSTPLSLLIQLTAEGDCSVCDEIARRHDVPPTLLEQLAKAAPGREDVWGVRSNVARNPNTPVTVLEKLSRDRDPSVRAAASVNPHTPVVVLERLVKDEDPSVRAAAARNPNTPPEGLAGLASDSDTNIRQALASNRNTPPHTLATLASFAFDEEDLLARMRPRWRAHRMNRYSQRQWIPG